MWTVHTPDDSNVSWLAECVAVVVADFSVNWMHWPYCVAAVMQKRMVIMVVRGGEEDIESRSRRSVLVSVEGFMGRSGDKITQPDFLYVS